MRIGVLQHVAFEPPAGIAEWALARGHELETTRLYAGDAVPEAARADALVIMGGPMNIRDEIRHPWLVAEKRLIGDVIRLDKPVLGVCLGAQLIADVLGARVYRNRDKEIGWFPLTATRESGIHPRYRLPERFTAFHWHGETFDLPDGAVHLARSEACEHQMFALGDRVLALQFHLEAVRTGIADMIRNCEADITPGKFVQSGGAMLDESVDFETPHRLLASLLDGWCDGGVR